MNASAVRRSRSGWELDIMTKQQLKRAILGALVSKLEYGSILDGVPSEQELERAMAAQEELATEFKRRAKGQCLSWEWANGV